MKLTITFIIAVLVASIDGQLNFAVIGNWGAIPNTPNVTDQTRVAERLDQWMLENAGQRIISTGDNFYPNGLETQDDQRFVSAWKNIYSTDNLINVNWAISVGNRDHNASDTRALYQVNKSVDEPTWRFPRLYYEEYIPGGDFLVHLIVLDTELLITDNFVNVPGYERQRQLEWFSNALTDAQPSEWTFVVGHHPLRSCGRYGPSNDPLITMIEQTLIDNNVDLYLSGHDQNQQRIFTEPPTYDQVITGGGGVGNYPINEAACDQLASAGYLNFFQERFGFTALQMNSSSLEVKYFGDQLNGEGLEELYSFTRRRL